MAESVAQVAGRIGIPAEKLEDLIELPEVSEALIFARERPGWSPEQVWAANDLPTIDPDGLDIGELESRLEAGRRLAEKGDGSRVPLEQRVHHPLLMGRLQKAEQIARRRLEIIVKVAELMQNHYAEPSSMQQVKDLLAVEIEKESQGL